MELLSAIREPGLEPAAIRAAHARIDAVFSHSPQYVHEGLSGCLSVPVIVKVESANPIRSFKGRGTSVAVGGLAREGRIGPDRPIACVSGRMVLVSEAALHAAQDELTAELGIAAEGAAAASWAGVLGGPPPDGPVLLIITGSNV